MTDLVLKNINDFVKGSPYERVFKCLSEIQEECFGDDIFFLESLFLAYKDKDAYVIYAEAPNGVIMAAAYLLPCEYMGKRVYYLYSLGAKKAFRGRGLGALIIERCKHFCDENKTSFFLLPANSRLYEYYKAQELDDCLFGVREKLIGFSEDEPQDYGYLYDLEKISADEYFVLREKYLTCLYGDAYISWDERSLSFASGEFFISRKEGVIISGYYDNRIFKVTEMLKENVENIDDTLKVNISRMLCEKCNLLGVNMAIIDKNSPYALGYKMKKRGYFAFPHS